MNKPFYRITIAGQVAHGEGGIPFHYWEDIAGELITKDKIKTAHAANTTFLAETF